MKHFKYPNRIEENIEHQGVTASNPALVYEVTEGKKFYCQYLLVSFQNNLSVDSVCSIADDGVSRLSFLVPKEGGMFTQFFDFNENPLKFESVLEGKTLNGAGGVSCSISCIGYEI